ncbi:phosphonate C-P lyase system protein PhnL [Prosthecodimorpha staleyi]|uniref:Phosphonate C-P lyase system protein PhnL n=1 Tax=Prosthecodimorpha staleyi TaxID=2840188 RepID=A0A947D827_9HYPH|nr:phosphonate C-P lyase system protein PhnL [Prosthecodimorpha staleyi]MBT9289777.1 phosphonate C-P lyase system protein PhnL [Prosthecodimorpha staleyi]
MTVMLRLERVSKSFVMHLQDGKVLPVVSGVGLEVAAGECVVLGGPSGAGKSSILKMIYGNYRCDAGRILVRDRDETVDVASAAPRRIVRLRQTTLGYVSQFLRAIPRVSALDLVVAAARDQGVPAGEAEIRARGLLAQLNVPERLWSLPPATFSGGEQQRVNIARGFVGDHSVLLLDEPTASLDARNRAAVVDLIADKKRRGVALIGIFHDEDVRDRVADRIVDVTAFAVATAA